MSDLIQKALHKAGYDSNPTEANLIECFLDYVAGGIYSNLTSEEAVDMINDGEITVKQMCVALIRF